MITTLAKEMVNKLVEELSAIAPRFPNEEIATAFIGDALQAAFDAGKSQALGGVTDGDLKGIDTLARCYVGGTGDMPVKPEWLLSLLAEVQKNRDELKADRKQIVAIADYLMHIDIPSRFIKTPSDAIADECDRLRAENERLRGIVRKFPRMEPIGYLADFVVLRCTNCGGDGQRHVNRKEFEAGKFDSICYPTKAALAASSPTKGGAE